MITNDAEEKISPPKAWWTKMAISRNELLSLAKEVDPGIQKAVIILNMFNIMTLQSCEGHKDVDGDNPNLFLNESKHIYCEPTVDFDGTINDGFKVFALMREHGLDVSSFRREWRIIDGEPTGPIWSMTFRRRLKPMTEEEISDLLDWYEL